MLSRVTYLRQSYYKKSLFNFTMFEVNRKLKGTSLIQLQQQIKTRKIKRRTNMNLRSKVELHRIPNAVTSRYKYFNANWYSEITVTKELMLNGQLDCLMIKVSDKFYKPDIM